VSIKSLERTLGPHGWIVSQRSFIPQAGIDSIRTKLSFKILEEYANILKSMYSTRLNGRPKNKGDHDQKDTVPGGPSPPFITSLQAW
jgi:hypothetical protein